MKLQPLDNRVVVKRLAGDQTTKAGIVLPDKAVEKSLQAKVVSVGPGRVMDDGSRSPIPLTPGDTILLSKWGGTEVKIDGEEYVVIKEDDVLAVLEN